MPSKNKDFFDDFIHYAKKLYGEDNISLHRPIFEGNEKKYLTECIDSNFVSSVGNRVSDFEIAMQFHMLAVSQSLLMSMKILLE